MKDKDNQVTKKLIADLPQNHQNDECIDVVQKFEKPTIETFYEKLVYLVKSGNKQGLLQNLQKNLTARNQWENHIGNHLTTPSRYLEHVKECLKNYAVCLSRDLQQYCLRRLH